MLSIIFIFHMLLYFAYALPKLCGGIVGYYDVSESVLSHTYCIFCLFMFWGFYEIMDGIKNAGKEDVFMKYDLNLIILCNYVVCAY